MADAFRTDYPFGKERYEMQNISEIVFVIYLF